MKWRGDRIRTANYGTDERNKIVGGGSTLLTKYTRKTMAMEGRTWKEQYSNQNYLKSELFAWDGVMDTVSPYTVITCSDDQVTYGANARDGKRVYPERIQLKVTATWEGTNIVDEGVDRPLQQDTLVVIIGRLMKTGYSASLAEKTLDKVIWANGSTEIGFDGELPLAKYNDEVEIVAWHVLRPDPKAAKQVQYDFTNGYVAPAMTAGEWPGYTQQASQTFTGTAHRNHLTVVDFDIALEGSTWDFESNTTRATQDALVYYMYYVEPQGGTQLQDQALVSVKLEKVFTFSEDMPKRMWGKVYRGGRYVRGRVDVGGDVEMEDRDFAEDAAILLSMQNDGAEPSIKRQRI